MLHEERYSVPGILSKVTIILQDSRSVVKSRCSIVGFVANINHPIC
jgi:hypothetical protein